MNTGKRNRVISSRHLVHSIQMNNSKDKYNKKADKKTKHRNEIKVRDVAIL